EDLPSGDTIAFHWNETLRTTKFKHEGKVMNDKFDELAKGMAQSVTRRGALKKFGLGLTGIALAALGLANKAYADPGRGKGGGNCNHCSGDYGCNPNDLACIRRCVTKCCVLCPK